MRGYFWRKPISIETDRMLTAGRPCMTALSFVSRTVATGSSKAKQILVRSLSRSLNECTVSIDEIVVNGKGEERVGEFSQPQLKEASDRVDFSDLREVDNTSLSERELMKEKENERENWDCH